MHPQGERILSLVGSLSSLVQREHRLPSAPLAGFTCMHGRGNAQAAEVRRLQAETQRKPRRNLASKELKTLIGGNAMLWPEFDHSLSC